jgi:hypothetical protein
MGGSSFIKKKKERRESKRANLKTAGSAEAQMKLSIIFQLFFSCGLRHGMTI